MIDLAPFAKMLRLAASNRWLSGTARLEGAGLHDPVAVRIRDEDTANEPGVDVSRVRRKHQDEVELILGAVNHEHVAVWAPAESGGVATRRVLPLARLVRFR